MALIPCPECGRQISQRAAACPHCGYPMDPATQAPDETRLRLEEARQRDRRFLKRAGVALGALILAFLAVLALLARGIM